MTSKHIQHETNKMVSLVRKHLSHERNPGDVPYWHHCESVSEILKYAFEKSGELDNKPERLHQLLMAALGHDLYEDTNMTPDDITNLFGFQVSSLIEGMTNRNGDHDTINYVAGFVTKSEEICLIKLCDCIENTISVAYSIKNIQQHKPALFNWFSDLMEETTTIIRQITFKKYPRTAKILINQFDFAWERLMNNLKRR